ncbi:MAG: hypothetical protein KKF46_01640 [Nanoarchaeota archaeon]|nr:hypothetical protein [Nanoarchaeota archaeon]MBU1321034.1 hypothetical protein [Nanoarchaeota archaeon]MBU1598448.1 hypothetical protein [Nanoarchaeota archaeon]MBU2441374.1 hypothetical protein [Nanoarchaeota archaeon]
MKSGFDISIIKGDGYLIMPLSVGRLNLGQSPTICYKMLDLFNKKLQTFSNDVIFLYTNGIYFNTTEPAYITRERTNKIILSHSAALRKMIDKKKQYVPNAFHFLPIDYVLLNSKYFEPFFKKLKDLEKKDKQFRKYIQKDMGERKYDEANVNFILEEVAIVHILRQKLVELPRTLVKNDVWRLVVYPGPPMYADLYQWKKKILLQDDKDNPFNSGQYDAEQQKMFLFDEVEL